MTFLPSLEFKLVTLYHIYSLSRPTPATAMVRLASLQESSTSELAAHIPRCKNALYWQVMMYP